MKPREAHKYPVDAAKSLFDKFVLVTDDGEDILVHNQYVLNDRLVMHGDREKTRILPCRSAAAAKIIADCTHITTWIEAQFSEWGASASLEGVTVVDPVVHCSNCDKRIIRAPENIVEGDFYCGKCHHVPEVRREHLTLDEIPG